MKLEKQLVWDIISTPANIDYKEYRETHDLTWLTQDRRIILIKNMEYTYIENCIAMLERADQEYTAAYKGLVRELKLRDLLATKINK